MGFSGGVSAFILWLILLWRICWTSICDVRASVKRMLPSQVHGIIFSRGVCWVLGTIFVPPYFSENLGAMCVGVCGCIYTPTLAWNHKGKQGLCVNVCVGVLGFIIKATHLLPALSGSPRCTVQPDRLDRERSPFFWPPVTHSKRAALPQALVSVVLLSRATDRGHKMGLGGTQHRAIMFSQRLVEATFWWKQLCVFSQRDSEKPPKQTYWTIIAAPFPLVTFLFAYLLREKHS